MIGARPRTTSQLINPRVRPSPTGVPPSSRAELVAPIVHDPSDVVAIGVAGLAMWVSRRPVASRELVRETASMTAEYAQTDRFRGARIHLCDLAGLEIRDCEVSGLKIVDCYGSDVYLGGDFERLVVNDVDVTMYVEAELDRQHPARLLAREATSADDYRAAWDVIEALWEATLDRARLLPEAKLHERVDDEWSLVETQRHLLFASDAWLGNAVLEEEGPYHPLGFPAGGMPADTTAKLGLTLEATPTLNEVLAPRRLRMATMRRVVEALTEAELDRTWVASRRSRTPTRSMSCAAASRWCSRKRPSITAMPCATSPCSRPVSEPSEDPVAVIVTRGGPVESDRDRRDGDCSRVDGGCGRERSPSVAGGSAQA